jgi:uncharacterized membrane protein YadS
MDFLKNKGKGIVLCLIIALFAWLLVNSIIWLEVIGAPVIAILMGMILTLFMKDKSSVSEGIGFTSKIVLQYATMVKLTRTLTIIPITLVLSILRIRSEKEKDITGKTNVSIRKIFPMFILYFILASVITTIITSFCSGAALAAAESGFTFLKQLSKFFIVMAMSAIGLNTNIIKLITKGGKPILMGFCCWLAIATVSLVLQNLLQIL